MTDLTPRRRPTTLATLAAGTVAAAALAGSALAAHGASAAGAAAASTSFGVAQLNIKRDNTEAQQRADLATVLPQADLVGINEGTGGLAAVRAYVSANGDRWHIFEGKSGVPGHQEEILLARKSEFSVVSGGSGTMLMCDPNGPNVPFPKVVNWRTYLHQDSGRTLVHIGIHLPPSIDAKGHPSSNTENVNCAVKTIDTVKAMVVDLGRQSGADRVEIVVTGDLNIDFVTDKKVRYRDFPYVRFDESDDPATVPSLRSGWAKFGTAGSSATFGSASEGRYIDYVYFWKRTIPKLTLDSQRVVGGLNSDHRAVVARMSLEHQG